MTGNPHALAARISRHLQDVEQVVQQDLNSFIQFLHQLAND